MKQHEMHVVITQVNGKPEATPVQTFVQKGTDYRSGWGLPMHANKVILSDDLKKVDVFEVGDRVCCQVNRGSEQNEDGLVSGGEWQTKTGTVLEVFDEATGMVELDDFDKQTMSLIRGDRGFPGKNIQPTNKRPEDSNPIYKLPRYSTIQSSFNTEFIIAPGEIGIELKTPNPDAIYIEFTYSGRVPQDQQLMQEAFISQPSCIRGCQPFGMSTGFYYCDTSKSWRFPCDGNYGPAILINMNELDEFLTWMDTYFGNLGDDHFGGHWRTAPGEYSKHCYNAVSLTLEDVKRRARRARYW